MPVLTRTPWFGPKTALGVGWTPTSWQGYVVCGVFLMLVGVSIVLWHDRGSLMAVGALTAVFIVIAALTSGHPEPPEDRED